MGFLLRHGGCFSLRRARLFPRVFSQTWLALMALEYYSYILPGQYLPNLLGGLTLHGLRHFQRYSARLPLIAVIIRYGH